MFGTIYQWVVALDAIDLEQFFEHFAATVTAAITDKYEVSQARLSVDGAQEYLF